MNEIIKRFERYMHKTLHLSINFISWKGQKNIPFFLNELFEFYEIDIFGRKILLVISRGQEEITPAEVQKYLDEVKKRWSGECVYVLESTSAHNRDRLIKRGIAFVIPGNQMYLPDFGIDFREHFIKSKEKSKKSLSPATQVVLISALLSDPQSELFTVELAKRFDYTVMTMNRAFDELKAASIGKVDWKGKERFWNFLGSKKELWEQSKSFMRSPVKSRGWISEIALVKNKPLAGLSALSHFSMLNPPSLPIYAMSHKPVDESLLLKRVLDSSDDAVSELEKWSYDPKLFQKEGYVDPFSLYLSLIESNDERIEMALEEMMGKFI